MEGLSTSARSYISKCNIYTDNLEKAQKILSKDFINHLSQLKNIDFEICYKKTNSVNGQAIIKIQAVASNCQNDQASKDHQSY